MLHGEKPTPELRLDDPRRGFGNSAVDAKTVARDHAIFFFLGWPDANHKKVLEPSRIGRSDIFHAAGPPKLAVPHVRHVDPTVRHIRGAVASRADATENGSAGGGG